MTDHDDRSAVEKLADEDTHHLSSGVLGMIRLSDLRAAIEQDRQEGRLH